MTNKLELEFSSINYQGSKVFSSLADVLGLSVDLVSFISASCNANHFRVPKENKDVFSLTPTQKVTQPYCMRKKTKTAPTGDFWKRICRHAH